MKIVDLEVADAIYAEEHGLGNEIRKLNYPQKYLLLVIANEVVSLEISDVTDTAYYLKIIDDNLLEKE